MGDGCLLSFVKLVAGAWTVRVTKRPTTPTTEACEVDQLRLQGQHLFRRRHLATINLAPNQGPFMHLACYAIDRHGTEPTFQGFGNELAFWHYCVTHVAVLKGVIHRSCLTARLPCNRTLATVYRLDQLLRLDWKIAENRCEVWAAFVDRAAKKQLPQWFIRRSADDPALIEPFAGCAPLSARAIRALEVIGEQCGYIPVARSNCVELFLQTLPRTSLRDCFIGKTVDSAIVEHMMGSIGDARLTEILRLPPCAEWCQQMPAGRIQDLLLSSTQQETWQRAWSTLSILPQPIFQRVAVHHLIAGFIRSYRALWSEEVAEKWGLILERVGKELPYDEWLRLLMEATAFCLRNPGLPMGPVVTAAFPPLYDAVVANRANAITDEMFGYFDWDKAKKLRKDVIDAYLSSCWPPEGLALTASRCQILRKVFNRLRKKWRGDEYLKSVAEGLKRRNKPEMLSVFGELSAMMNDPEFFEPWD